MERKLTALLPTDDEVGAEGGGVNGKLHVPAVTVGQARLATHQK
jgi:hypothetical protein